MQLPFHGAHVCGDILFAARSGHIHSFSSDGAHISCWKYPVEAKAAKNGQGPTPTPPQDDNEPPAKRVKLESHAEPQKRKKGQPKKPGPLSQPSDRPMVIIMASTKNGKPGHLVAVTSDKSIWVFEHDGRGALKQLSRRYVDSHISTQRSKCSPCGHMVALHHHVLNHPCTLIIFLVISLLFFPFLCTGCCCETFLSEARHIL